MSGPGIQPRDGESHDEPDPESAVPVEPETSTAGAILTMVVGLLGTLGCTGFFVIQALAMKELKAQFAELGIGLPGITVMALKLSDIWPVIALLLFVGMTVGTLFLAFRSHGCMRSVALGGILFVGAMPGTLVMVGAFIPLQHIMEEADEPPGGTAGAGAGASGATGATGATGAKGSRAPAGADGESGTDGSTR